MFNNGFRDIFHLRFTVVWIALIARADCGLGQTQQSSGTSRTGQTSWSNVTTASTLLSSTGIYSQSTWTTTDYQVPLSVGLLNSNGGTGVPKDHITGLLNLTGNNDTSVDINKTVHEKENITIGIFAERGHGLDFPFGINRTIGVIMVAQNHTQHILQDVANLVGILSKVNLSLY